MFRMRPFMAMISFLLCAAWSRGASAAIFRVDLGPLGRTPGTLEISSVDDPKRIVNSIALGSSNTYNLEFPAEGLYILRAKSKKKVIWKEQVFVLLKKLGDENLLKVSWRMDESSVRTVIKVQNPKGQVRYGISIRDRIFLRLRSAPRLIRFFNEDPGGLLLPAQDLTLVAISEKEARAEAAPDEEATLQLEPSASDDDQVSYEPDYKGLLAGKEDETWRQKILDLAQAKSLPPLNRKHRVIASLRILQEEFSVKRNGVTYEGDKSQGFGTGFAVNLIYKELLTAQVEGDTHGTKTQYETSGGDTPAEEQKRIHARIGPLIDVLNINHAYPKYSLEVGPVVGYNQIPLESDNQTKMDIGGAFRSQYFGTHHVEAQFRFFRSHSWDFTLQWTGSLLLQSINPIFAYYKRHTEFESGASKALFEEQGLRFGLGYSF